jgi:hypothetical protein
MKRLPLLLSTLFVLGLHAADPYFHPSHRASAVGAARQDLSDDLVAVRADLMVRSQTFAIMREPLVAAGAGRIVAPKLQALFRAAAKSSGFPHATLEAMSFLESWGDPRAESYAGPKGIMQISEATARRMGLKIVHRTRYKVVAQKVPVRRRGKTVIRTVQVKTPYSVLVRDERLIPEKAIPAAARYLAGLEQRYRGRDWAVFAYHCGEGCVAEMMELTRQARGVPKDQVTVNRMFFAASPAWNRDLYQAVARNMERDYSPTYWFRVQRAEQLLALYRRDRAAFERLAAEYRSDFQEGPRAPHRLSVWLKQEDFVFATHDAVRADRGRRLAQAPDQPAFFGYKLAADEHRATPAALGALLYIAFETRRLFDAMKPRGERWTPLEVSALTQPADRPHAAKDPRVRADAHSHSSGQVFDLSVARLPAGEREALQFVLSDLGWEGYLGFVEEGADILHIGGAPTARAFFTEVYEEAVKAAR